MGFGRVLAATLLASLAACTSYESAYERSVYEYEPVYCYQSLAAVSCYRKPQARDARRLVNYYGPAPSKYRQPEAAEEHEWQPPPESDRYAIDPEPDPSDPTGAKREAERSDGDWKQYLPLLTILFGAAQVAAAFIF
jgi:hypothetical protein